MFNNGFFENCVVYNLERFCRVRHATDDNMAHAHCMLDTHGYKYTLSEYVLFISFPPQKWIYEGASIFRCT
jgi:hypothetical protein